MRRFARILHLLWIVPLTAASYLVATVIAAMQVCGIGSCRPTFGEVRFEPNFGGAVIVLCLAAAIGFGAISAVPWIRPWWIRVVVGIAVTAVMLVPSIAHASELRDMRLGIALDGTTSTIDEVRAVPTDGGGWVRKLSG